MEDPIIVEEIVKSIQTWLRSERTVSLRDVVSEGLKEWRKKVNYKNNNTPKWLVKILLNEGYGKQCMELELAEGETVEEAKQLAEEKVVNFYLKKQEDIIEIKVKRNNGHIQSPLTFHT